MQPFVVGTWKQRPCLFDRLPVEVVSEVYDLSRLETIMSRMKDSDLFCRRATGGVGEPMPRILNSGFTGCLERRLEKECLSINMSNLQKYDSVISEVLDRFVRVLAPAIQMRPSDILYPTAAIFLSSPRATTCYHDDRENNFLMHLRGRKTLHVFPSKATIASEFVKACFRKRQGIHETYRSDLERDAQMFPMPPRTTLYIPRLCPHWVDNGSEVSVSMSLNFFTHPDYLLEKVYAVNDRLRAAVGRWSGRERAASGKY